jgi:hypothetical protein
VIDLTLDNSPQKTSFHRFKGSPDRANHRVATPNQASKIKVPILRDRRVQTPISRVTDKVTLSPAMRQGVVTANEFLGGTKNLFSMTRRSTSKLQ